MALCEKTNSVNGSLRMKMALGNYFLVPLHGTGNFRYHEILGLDIPYRICPVVVKNQGSYTQGFSVLSYCIG